MTTTAKHPTVEQNAAHRNDIVWAKTGKSEYLNQLTGQTIRKDWRMTGQDWMIFDAKGTMTGRAHSLTWAKMDAAA